MSLFCCSVLWTQVSYLFSLFFKLCSTLHTGPRAGFHCWGIFFFFWTSIFFFSFQQRCHRYFCVSLCFQLCVGYPLDWLYFNPKVATFTEMSFVKSAWKAALNLKSMLGNRFPWLSFLFLFLPKTTMRSVPAVLPPSPPHPSQLHNETFVSKKILVRIALLNILIRNVISPDQY